MDTGRVTRVLIDGENIDATLGVSILGRRPQPDERPRWDRLIRFAAQQWGQPARGIFYLNASTNMPMTFVQALLAMDIRVVPLSGSPDQKVVDIAIQRTLRALADRGDDVMLVSHDGDFVDDLTALTASPMPAPALTPPAQDADAAAGHRRVGVIAFAEFRNARMGALPGVELFDLEYDARVFDAPLDRIRVIPIAEFDPASVLR